jgi:two-component system, chemotaxis family, protein-glutamate methylesterase/glutaminase
MNVVVVAASLGGVEAVGDLLSGLPADFPAAVLVVQHRTASHNGLLEEILSRRTALRVQPGKDGEPIRTGTAYVAPGGCHLLLDPDGLLRLSQSDKVRHVRPAADVLLESVAANHEGRIVAVVLTGMDGDGSDGAVAVKEAGGYVIAQSPTTARAPSMPISALSTGAVDETLPLWGIAPALVKRLAVSQ